MAKKKSREELRKERAQKARDRAKKKQMKRRGTHTLDYTGEFWKPRTSATVAILPYKVTDPKHPDADVGEEAYGRPYRIHRIPTVENKTIAVVCPTTIGKSCPVCKAFAELSWDDDKEEKRKLKYSERELYNLLDYKDDKVYLFDYPMFWFGEQLNREIAEGEEDWGGFFYADDLGFDLKLRDRKSVM